MNKITRFLHSESAGGILLLAIVVLALLLSNSSLAPLYFKCLQAPLFLEHRGSTMTVQQWINDGLMALFFLGIGLEIKRELASHELRSLGILPFTMALGGIVVPALIFSLATSGSAFQQGWAIPTATDIAFTLGLLSLLGNRIPKTLRLAVVSLAVIDDLGAVVIIALFYNSSLSYLFLGLSVLVIIVQSQLHRLRSLPFYLVLALGILLWYCMLHSGIHPTLAGIVTGLLVPYSPRMVAFEHRLEKIVTWLITPVFALANAGVMINTAALSELFANGVFVGLVLGLVLGKPLGIMIATKLSLRYSRSSFPTEVTTPLLLGAAMLCGIGFTMSLFVTTLAYGASPLIVDTAKIGVLCGSVISGILGYSYLRIHTNTKATKH